MVSRSSEQNLMAKEFTSPTTLSWIWVVEVLASSDQVDVSVLIDLVKKIPEISGDLGQNARERVSFRILENLLKRNWNKDNTSFAAGSKIRFDPSESCEDVLVKIMQELSASNMKMSGPQELKWDIQSFVTYKRSTLPQCALVQLKDRILKGDPQLATLKERSGLSTTNQSGKATSVDGIAFNGTKEMREKSNAKLLAQNINSVASTQDNKNNREETLQDLLLAKKRKSISADHLNLCIKCNRGGQLLVCSSKTCPLVVHDSCLPFPNFDKDGKFCCPHCAYSRAHSQYMEVKKKASLALKDFEAFIGPLKNVSTSEELSENSSRNSLRDISLQECRAENPQENQAGQDTLSPKGDDQQHNETLHPMHVLPCTEVEIEKANVPQLVHDQPESSQKSEKQCSYQAILRRKKVPWTKEEVEALMDGVDQCKIIGKRKMPWKEILEFGGDRFRKGRTTVDLKDKWRNICRGIEVQAKGS